MPQNTTIIFDIDGTLIDSFMISGQVYKDAVLATMPNAKIKEHWSDFQHVTDSGILKEVASDNNLPIGDKVELARKYFVKSAIEILGKTPCEEILGAKAFFAECKAKHPVGIATGCWKASGEIKLGTAGFTKDQVVYFGDAVWDVKTTTNLGWNFIGIGPKLEGKCQNWFPDYTDPKAIFETIAKLCNPK